MSNNPTSEKLTFRELISKHSIEIPIIQRDYAQGREGKTDIRTNFLNALLEVSNGKILELDFVYGSVKDNVFQPLDGQQRLTTLFLLHWFVAIKEGKLDSNFKELLTKFTYETRTSSRDFCRELINKGIDFNNLIETDYFDKENTKPKNNGLSKTIIDSSWFFLTWKRDPTIKSMLIMLDSIYHTFIDKLELLEKLDNISFHYIELQNFGLSDDLYIKMNARGKHLTDFENFKAKFEQYITKIKYKIDDNGNAILENGNKIILKDNWEKDIIDPKETFSHQIDTLWTDLFWNYRNYGNIFDEQFLNFFRTMAVVNYTLKANDKDDKFRKNLDVLRGNQTLSFNKYLELECFDSNYFKTLKSVLNKISDKNGLKTFLSDTTYVNEKENFNGVIKNNLGYAELLKLFALYQYLGCENDIDKTNLQNWMRIVRNLLEAHRLYYDNANTFADSLLFFSKLIPHRNNIIEYFKDSVNPEDKGFPKFIIEEEKTKANLILQNDDWKMAIVKIENHGYFNGQIGFLLDWCKDENGLHSLNNFIKYAEKTKAIFSDEGLKNFDNFLFERALLATGNYLLSKGRNRSFLISKGRDLRDISWKRLLRDDNEQRKVLKSLFDKIKLTTLNQDLENIITDFSDKNDWRYYFIKQFEMIDTCGEQKLIRIDDSRFDILLLGSTMTSGFHKEYYSYSLFEELSNKLSLEKSSYKDQKSVDLRKYFELNGQRIAFDCKTKKYVWSQNEEWDNKQEFENRNKAILELTKT
ncbi:hypothetical protein pgond44_14008 [Psychroflexus gondwanensis ACAM 44]|jgi:hypothetical protein|uniref:GmrSD restriction endonucleases N-terminal domain-containing protein n=1 Tax=Psychroflexus gondwanensis ACAM 44 TaxID=1189619 RepID=N1WSD7_9FLAO|nr:DUF262 domain-containing protein [Psychroflexus gondwanensis]EMY80024.1 hypothetical protein pgond44_14008 [Psychroflexus gondwanensis ACAM 44]